MAEQIERLTYSVPAFAAAIGISRANAYDLVSKGFVPAVRLRGRWLIPRKAVDDMLANAKSPTTTAR